MPGPLLFFIYSNDLHSCLKYSKAYHFSDDTNITILDSLQETLPKRMNDDLRKLSTWLRANKFYLNVKKKRTCVLKIKCKIIMKYLGVLSDETSQSSNWNTQQAKWPNKHSYTQNSILFSLWNSSSLCLPVMESKQQRYTKSNFNSPKQTSQK